MDKPELYKLSRQQAAERTGEGLNVIDLAIKNGHLKSFVVGRRRFVTPEALQAWTQFAPAPASAPAA